MTAGRGPVYLDCTSIAPELWQEWEAIGHNFINFMRAAAIDYHNDRVVLVPALHCLLGGVIIDAFGSTGVPGLYAAGEATTGTHGAVRLGGSAFAECFVFGARAGAQAASDALSTPQKRISGSQVQGYLDQLIKGRPVESTYLRQRLADLQETAWNSLGVIRSGEPLGTGVRFFGDVLEEQGEWESATRESLELSVTIRNLALTGLTAANAAMARQESRGGHIRDDFPEENDAFLTWFISSSDNPYQCRQRQIQFAEDDLKPSV
jgi:aspartate oxidase